MAAVTIKIKINRIYFEQFEAPCGEPELTEIRLEWERAVIAVIEKHGFQADLETTHVGHSPAPSVYIIADRVTCEYAEDEGEGDWYYDDCEGVRAYGDLVVLAEDYGKMIAEKAIEAGVAAADKQSAEFVEASEN